MGIDYVFVYLFCNLFYPSTDFCDFNVLFCTKDTACYFYTIEFLGLFNFRCYGYGIRIYKYVYSGYRGCFLKVLLKVSESCIYFDSFAVILVLRRHTDNDLPTENNDDPFFVVTISMFYDEEHSKLFTAFNQQVSSAIYHYILLFFYYYYGLEAHACAATVLQCSRTKCMLLQFCFVLLRVNVYLSKNTVHDEIS